MPRVIVTDKLRSYGVAQRQLLPVVEHRQSRYLNNRAENSLRPTRRRERQMQRFKSSRQAQIFFQLTHSSTITSIPAAIVLPPVPTEQSGPTNLEFGTRRRVPNVPHNVCAERSLPELLRLSVVNVTMPASLYEAFPAAEARRIAERFEWHYTPKHGSWLNMAETELSVLSGQCLDRRIPDKVMLTEEAAAWTAQRNQKHAKADWQFTTADARVKLKRLYPSI